MVDPGKGILLISDPFLKDPNFMRTVVLLCEHNEEGSFGLVVNRTFDHTLDELINGLEGFPIPVYYGGPVQQDTLHFLHCTPDTITGGLEIAPGIFWGGDFEQVIQLLKAGDLDLATIHFYIGYSGWGNGQLADEMKEKSWLTVTGTRKLIFQTETDFIWKESIKSLGSAYEQIIHYPIDPQLN